MQKQNTDDDFFESLTLTAIADALAGFRIQRCRQRHRRELYRQLCRSPELIPEPEPDLLDLLLPPRKTWQRPRRSGRKVLDPRELLLKSLQNTLRPRVAAGESSLRETAWGRRFLEFAENLREKARHPERGFPLPQPRDIPKANGETRTLLVQHDLYDRVLLRLLFKQLGRYCDPLLSGDVFAFRKGRVDGRHQAVDLIRNCIESNSSWYAGEADIQGFFDRVQHQAVRDSLQEANDAIPGGIPPVLIAWVEAYLRSANQDGHARGLPQGGALSPLLCNLVLRKADSAVRTAGNHPEMLYLRYCDDILILHPSLEGCERALDAYRGELAKIGLDAHPAVSVTNTEASRFLQAKSKKPHLWADTPDRTNAFPWISFMGYEFHRSGSLRVREKSLARHRQKLDRELGYLKKLLIQAYGHKKDAIPLEILHEIRLYFTCKTVGRDLRRQNQGGSHHWAGAFPRLQENVWLKPQLKKLDRQMEQRFHELQKELLTDDAQWKAPFHPRPYFGAPFSYTERIRSGGRHFPKRYPGVRMICDPCFLLDDFLSTEQISG